MGPIGVFDSGYGGLTVLSEIQALMPEYDYVYLGDNARTPYGSRSFDVIYNYTLQAVRTLFAQGCPLVILACNTASAKALRTIQQKDLPSIAPDRRVLGVIRPSAEEVGRLTASRVVGVLGTTGTVKSASYVLEIQKLFPDIAVEQEACPLWVPLIENNEFDTPGGRYFIEHYVNRLLAKNPKMDTLILGCTHYPILKDIIKELIPEHVNIIAQGEIVAVSLKDYLSRHPEMENRCSKNGKRTFFTTEHPRSFEEKAELFLGYELDAQHIDLIED